MSNNTPNNAGHFNTGHGNTGHLNTGNYNAGHENCGDFNTGHGNTGDWNTGNRNAGRLNTGHYNTGHGNTGHHNTGYWNAGRYNTGNYNTGNYNTGHFNTGNHNIGNFNSGDWNTGDWNTGDRNAGNCNTGNWNSCNYSTGFFNTIEQPLYMFNRPVEGLTRRDLDTYLKIRLTEWILPENMTEEEKREHPEWETCDGYLKERDFKEACVLAWAKADKETKDKFLNLPNFDPDIFYEITGIGVRTAPKEEEKITIDGREYPLSKIKKALKNNSKK